MQWEASSKPLAVDDPLLRPEREVHAEIGINWFLDQEIPKGGYVRILAESLLWEARLGKTRIRTRSSVRFRLKPDNSNSHEFELHRPSNKGTKLLLKVIKAIIIIYRGPHYMHGAAQRVDNCEQQLEFFTKAMVRPRTRADHGHSRGN